MSALSKVLRDTEGNGLMFHCPGCRQAHRIIVGDGAHPCWSYNNNPGRPTFTPSILVPGRQFTAKGQADYEAWYAAGCPKNEDGTLHEFESADTTCHSFVTDGQIQFLSDCTHALAGQTVPLPDFKS